MKIYDDKHVGEKIGIYEILYMRDYKSNDGHKVYHIKCNECGWESDIQYRNIKHLSQKCNHHVLFDFLLELTDIVLDKNVSTVSLLRILVVDERVVEGTYVS